MFKIGDLLNNFRNTGKESSNSIDNTNSVRSIKNWYEERYENTTVQRNLLFVLLIILLCLSIVSIVVVAYVISAKRFDPFVIQVDGTTGSAKIVDPVSSTVLSGNEALAQYFIKKYVLARETYNPVDYGTISRKTIRLLSSNSVYWGYRGYIKHDEFNPAIKYGQKNTTFLKVKSWSKLAANKYILRFSVTETEGSQTLYNKIAIVEFRYIPMELTEQDKDINPIGFQITGYRVDDDNS